MKVGLFLGQSFASEPDVSNVVDRAVGLAREAADAGLHTVWFGQATSYDAMQLAALVGREVPRIYVGTAIVPIYPRHPLVMAAAAKTAQAATAGRFRLGIGLGSRTVHQPIYGVPYPPPIPHLRDYLSVLRPLLAGDMTGYEGQTITSRPLTPTVVAGADPEIPVLVAAMGPKALAVTGELADGTLPYLAGPTTLSRDIVPAIARAAADNDRRAPEIVAGVPVVVTDDPAAARSRLHDSLRFHDRIPSYQKIVAAEGLSSATDLAIAGDEHTVTTGLRRYRDAGVTELMLTHTDLFNAETRARTFAALAQL